MASPYPPTQAEAASIAYRSDVAKPPQIAPERPMTEMENLCALLADTARSLTMTADRFASRVDGFMQMGQTSDPKGPPEIEPAPSTLSALRYWHKKIEDQAMRLSGIQSNLAGIL